ncbi:unnamed protein product [Phytophthora lilii]|uniref:Unnamed protein product n=1 Tax=Phytophthora lilii TaxID=2077276 RepID=A0A9W6TBF3_9STRA|nr:unnamed protein product [Phytophthora lilii]
MARRGSFRDGGGPSSEESLPSANDGCGPVLGQIHVSCYVTAANRATPVFDVLPQHNCVRVVSRPNSDSSAGQYGASGTSTGAMPSAEWEFHSVFSSSSHSHAIDFFTEITLPALRTARDGINSNIVVWGVHPTQKFRLLFGKSVGGGGFAPQAEMAVNDVVELYGQLVGMLHAFFSQLDLGSRQKLGQEAEPWRLGISSWIIVNNQAIDLLKAPIGGTSGDGSRMSTPSALHDSLSFVSLEATSLATAFRIVQTAKTNRIVRKQNTESVHFFVRLALFHGGQVSTVHLVDIIDQKDFQDHVLVQEKLEFYNILQSLRLPSPSPRQSGTNGASSVDSLRSVGKMLLSNFMLPLLTANAKTFMYANVIDSRTNLRESVQMLNAVANLRCFACVCRPLRGVSYEQLGFQASPDDFERQEPCSQQEQLGKNQIQTDVESRPILNRSASSPPLGASHHASSSINPSEKQILDARSSALISRDGESESDAMSWLNAFAQRKRDILGGSIDMIDTAPLTTRVTENPVTDPMIYTASENRGEHGICEQTCGTPSMNPSVADLYEQLRESLEDVKDIELAKPKTPRASYCSLHSSPPDQSVPDLHAPLPIVDQYDDQEVDYAHIGYSRSTIGGITRHQMQQQTDDEVSTWTQTNYAAINHFQNREVTDADDAGSRPEVDPVELKSMPATSFSSPATLPTPSLASKPNKITLKVFKKAGVHPSALEPPNLDGLDVKTAQKVQAADATLLRKNYDALLSIVREQQQAKEAAEAHAAEALHDQEEMRAMFEVQIENMKLANVGLRSKVRALENKTSLPQVFEQYEQELRTLHAQVQELQARNVALELRVATSTPR